MYLLVHDSARIALYTARCMNEFASTSDAVPFSNPPPTYEISVEGNLGHEWTDWFDGMTFSFDAAANETRMTGAIADQAALHGVLGKIRDLGLNLVQVRRQSDTPKA